MEVEVDIQTEEDLVDLELCDSLLGPLNIYELAEITSVDLPCLRTAGSLYVGYNESLESISLPSLEEVTVNLRIANMDALDSLDLSSLTTVPEGINISDLASLPDLEGLSSLATLTSGLSIYRNDSLGSLDGLSSLVSVGGSLYIQDNASLCQADAEAFAASVEVVGSVTVADNGSARTDCP